MFPSSHIQIQIQNSKQYVVEMCMNTAHKCIVMNVSDGYSLTASQCNVESDVMFELREVWMWGVPPVCSVTV